jgi:hypothetical protein
MSELNLVGLDDLDDDVIERLDIEDAIIEEMDQKIKNFDRKISVMGDELKM